VIQYLGVDIGAEGSEKLISPSHKMGKIEQAIPVWKLALYYAAAQYIERVLTTFLWMTHNSSFIRFSVVLFSVSRIFCNSTIQ
jgi:hypothetical protein